MNGNWSRVMLIVLWLAVPGSAQERVNFAPGSEPPFVAPSESFEEAFFRKHPEAKVHLASGDYYEKLRSRLPTVEIDERQYYVVEGDLLLEEAELYMYSKNRELQDRLAVELKWLGGREIGGSIIEPSYLLAEQEAGRIVRWAEGLVLSYRVDRATFGSSDEYNKIVLWLRAACSDWERTCGVKFQHFAQLDEKVPPNADPPLFTVRKMDSQGKFVAASFFPNHPLYRRHLLIDPKLFAPDLKYDRIGVLRHELGHILGLKHEHIRSGAPPECPHDESPGIAITDYDPQSVMHYFCGGIGNPQLIITQLDQIGSQRIYGQSLDKVRFFR